MNKLNSLKDFSFEEKNTNEGNETNKRNNDNLEKVLCFHCGRTASNRVRCLGMCVADNDY